WKVLWIIITFVWGIGPILYVLLGRGKFWCETRGDEGTRPRSRPGAAGADRLLTAACRGSPGYELPGFPPAFSQADHRRPTYRYTYSPAWANLESKGGKPTRSIWPRRRVEKRQSGQ